MNTEHLEYFITVSEIGSINKAAQLLFVSQPRLGKILHDLEDDLGVVLLQRSSRGVILTPEGREFLKHAKKVVRECEHIRRLGHMEEPENSLEVSMTKFSHIMECFIAVILRHKEEPQFSHRLEEGGPFEVMEDVASHFFQIGVINFDDYQREQIRAEMEDKELEYHHLARTKPHILVAENHPLLREGKPLTLEMLSAYPFVRYLGQFEDLTYRILRAGNGGSPPAHRVIYTRERATLLRLIGSSDFYGLGIRQFENQIDAYHVRSIPVEDSGELEFGYVLKKEAPVRSITREFIAELKRRFCEEAGTARRKGE